MNKKCTQCQKVKPLTEFTKATHSLDGKAWKCKECQAKFMAEKTRIRKLEEIKFY